MSLSEYIHTHTHSKGKNKNEQTDEFGADQLGACIHINISTPGRHHSRSHPLPNPPSVCVCVCFPLTTSGCVYNNSCEPRCLLFLSPAPLHQLSVAWSARVCVSLCRSGWLPGFFWGVGGLAGLACLPCAGLLFRLLCADGEGANVTSQKRHALSYVNSK